MLKKNLVKQKPKTDLNTICAFAAKKYEKQKLKTALNLQTTWPRNEDWRLAINLFGTKNRLKPTNYMAAERGLEVCYKPIRN